jgi:aryl-alcohol dehydrogenase-like predicted oxidoreductase
MEIAQAIEARGMTAAVFAILWLLNNGMISSIIAGPRSCETISRLA